MAGSLRSRIEQSDALAGVLGRLLSGYLRLCFATGRWRSAGEDDLNAALEQGPVTVICWHGRLVMAPVVWQRRARVAIPRDPSPAGRLSAATQARLGTESFAINLDGGNFAAVRQIIRLVRSGVSLGLTADGPEGPDRVAKRAAIDWARATGRPVVCFAWGSAKAKRLNTWDRMLLPVPFGGGAFVYRVWDQALPKSPSEAEYMELEQSLAAGLESAAAEADRLAGA